MVGLGGLGDDLWLVFGDRATATLWRSLIWVGW
jgi:hypothetical protein